MPTLVELFKNKTITDGPNAGKTAEKAYEVQNSKDVLVQTSNSFLKPSVNFINKRRKDGIRLGETRIEEETTGLRALTDNAKFVLYGGDSFRIINGTTRTMRAMLRNSDKSGAGLDDSITDKIGSALSMLCPPAKGIPAILHMYRAPSSTSLAFAAGIFSIGQPNMANAIMGLPPIAYTSLMALAAAILPKVYASSTIGMKKSVV
ncbi:MAG: hypothetical protein RLZ08_846, partial [Pseudomonadota bacterium]